MNDLYIFLHIPKCAGNTIMHKLFMDVSSKEIFTPGYHPEGPDEPSDKFFGKDRMLIALDAWARWNDPEKVRFIHSHHVYYGIHELFPNKIPHYVVFFRNPIDIIVSYFNYGCGIPRTRYLSRTIYRGNTMPTSFKYWVNNNPYYSQEFLIGFLQDRGFPINPLELKDGLWHIGFVHDFKNSFYSLCDKIGFGRGYENKNVSQNKGVHPDKKTIPLLADKNERSIKLFYDLRKLCHEPEND